MTLLMAKVAFILRISRAKTPVLPLILINEDILQFGADVLKIMLPTKRALLSSKIEVVVVVFKLKTVSLKISAGSSPLTVKSSANEEVSLLKS